jgi:mannose-1-phosphate guanylyltransferase/mannose-6-phosphate isomerase
MPPPAAAPIVPLILAGGSGTRLWPLSRQSYPKQFAPLHGGESLFAAAARRFAAPGWAPPVVVTGTDFRFIAADQLAAAGIAPGALIIEPSARNTAPAILAGTLAVARERPEALVLAAPADHLIADAAGLRAAVARAAGAARAGRIVAFGIRPTRAETGYGWIEPAAAARADGPPVPLRRFVEKPAAAAAAAMFAAGRHLWNAGLFLYTPRRLIDAFRAQAPGILAAVETAVARAAPDLGFLRLDPAAWAAVEAISFDHAIMEHDAGLSVQRYDGAWSDLGDWQAVWRAGGPDTDGNVLQGAATAIGCRGSLLRAEGAGLALVGIGLEDMLAVAMPDAVLVAPRARAQEVRAAVAALTARGAAQATTFPRDHRPWGWFDRLAAGDRFQVKRIVVHPGAALSLQSHEHRAEHWIVVAGTARVTLDGTARTVGPNESVYIPQGARHRLENPGPGEMVLIEVQTGSYLGEDDITRYEDRYARGPDGSG